MPIDDAGTRVAARRRVWITRARPGADATAERVRALGLEAVVEPLLKVQPLQAQIDLAGVSAIVFTSANAVEAFASVSAERALRVFAVGDATATAAKARGFSRVLSAQGDVTALAVALRSRRRELPGALLYPAAAEPARDLGDLLSADGLTVRQVALYETVSAEPSEALTARLPQIDTVLLHSAKAAGLLAAFLKVHPAPHLRAFCLSQQVVRALGVADLARVSSAPEPNETALLALIG